MGLACLRHTKLPSDSFQPTSNRARHLSVLMSLPAALLHTRNWSCASTSGVPPSQLRPKRGPLPLNKSPQVGEGQAPSRSSQPPLPLGAHCRMGRTVHGPPGRPRMGLLPQTSSCPWVPFLSSLAFCHPPPSPHCFPWPLGLRGFPQEWSTEETVIGPLSSPWGS